jgi:predicted dinucleotide-binding enzyme
MTVGIVGAGRMGCAIARAVAASGEPVLLARSRPGGGVRGGPLPVGCRQVSLAEVWRRASTVLVALPFPGALELMSGPAGAVGAGRTLIDVTNPAFTNTTLPPGRSGGELIAEAASSWQVAKAFNTVPATQFAACRLQGEPVTVPVAGGWSAKVVAFPLARRLGFAPVDAGQIDASRELESLAALLARISDTNGLHGRIAIHIGQPEPPAGQRAAAARSGVATGRGAAGGRLAGQLPR